MLRVSAQRQRRLCVVKQGVRGQAREIEAARQGRGERIWGGLMCIRLVHVILGKRGLRIVITQKPAPLRGPAQQEIGAASFRRVALVLRAAWRTRSGPRPGRGGSRNFFRGYGKTFLQGWGTDADPVSNKTASTVGFVGSPARSPAPDCCL